MQADSLLSEPPGSRYHDYPQITGEKTKASGGVCLRKGFFGNLGRWGLTQPGGAPDLCDLCDCGREGPVNGVGAGVVPHSLATIPVSVMSRFPLGHLLRAEIAAGLSPAVWSLLLREFYIKDSAEPHHLGLSRGVSAP